MVMPQMPNLTDAERERIRAYLNGQAHKLSLAELVEKVRTDTAPLQAVAAAVPADKFHLRPADEDWSAAEVMEHIITMNEHGASAIEGIIATGAVPAAIRDEMAHEEAGNTRDAGSYWRQFISRREQLYERVSQARGDEHLDVLIEHPLFGMLDWRAWLLFMRVHDLDHMRQLQSVSAHFAEG